MLTRAFMAGVVAVATLMLLVPGVLMAVAWGGTLNLEVAGAAVASTIVTSIWLPRIKWMIAAVAALIIAVPPYPYWTNWSEDRGQYLHFFHGFALEGRVIADFGVVFVLAMLLFSVIFAALGRCRRKSSQRVGTA